MLQSSCLGALESQELGVIKKTTMAYLQVEELNIDMEPGDIVDDILGEHRVMLQVARNSFDCPGCACDLPGRGPVCNLTGSP